MTKWKVTIRKKTGSVIINVVVKRMFKSMAETRAKEVMLEVMGIPYNHNEHMIYSREMK